MNNALRISLLAAAAFAVNALFKARAGGMLNFYPGSIMGFSFDGFNPVVKIGVAVQNPTSSNFNLRALAGNLYANGTLIGNVSNFSSTVVPANSETIYQVSVKLAILGIVNDLIRVFKKESAFKYKIDLEGWANVNNFSVPLKLSYQLGNG